MGLVGRSGGSMYVEGIVELGLQAETEVGICRQRGAGVRGDDISGVDIDLRRSGQK